MRKALAAMLAFCLAAGFTERALAEQGPAERVGEKIDRGVSRIADELRRGWAEVQKSIDKLGVEGRVYGRLHWDKSLNEANLEIQAPEKDVIVLRGSVPNTAAKRKAVLLAGETVGVSKVVDELTVSEPPKLSR